MSFRIRVHFEMAAATTGSVVASAFGFSGSGQELIFTNPLLPETRISGHRGEADLTFSTTVPQSATQVLVDASLFAGNSNTSTVGDDLIYSTR